jgi:hypothetical protein
MLHRWKAHGRTYKFPEIYWAPTVYLVHYVADSYYNFVEGQIELGLIFGPFPTKRKKGLKTASKVFKINREQHSFV